ncbi:MAG TPA: DUF2950 family protein [bacterium]|nr:DUF2950 family protein [bacterium]
MNGTVATEVLTRMRAQQNDPIPAHRQSGFTLIEMLIVTTLIGVVAGVAVPNLLSSRLTANEAAVIANLRAISTAQFQFQSSGELDTNGDAGFEYGTLGELAAIDGLRSGAGPLSRNLLSKSVATVDANGWATHHGYHFALFLPDASGVGVVGLAANAASFDPLNSHRFWTCVAWPVQNGVTGKRAFFVNQQGQVLACGESGYSGSTAVPAAGAGLVGSDPNRIDSQRLAGNTLGADGNQWLLVH